MSHRTLRTDIAKLQYTEEGCTALALLVIFGGFLVIAAVAVVANIIMMIGDAL